MEFKVDKLLAEYGWLPFWYEAFRWYMLTDCYVFVCKDFTVVIKWVHKSKKRKVKVANVYYPDRTVLDWKPAQEIF